MVPSELGNARIAGASSNAAANVSVFTAKIEPTVDHAVPGIGLLVDVEIGFVDIDGAYVVDRVEERVVDMELVHIAVLVADLPFDPDNDPGTPGDITYGEAFTVQPFNNYLVSMNLTGQQIYDLLTQQVTGSNAGAAKILQVSNGFSYQLGTSGPVDGSVKLNGTPINKGATYRIVTNNFLSDGGDGFPAFKDGTDKYFGGLDIDAFADYLGDKSPYTPGPLVRITK